MMNDESLLKRITFDPRTFGGKPIVRGLRIAVEHVLAKLAAGETSAHLLKEYPFLELEDIQACLLYAYRSLSGEQIVDRLAGTKGS